MKSHVHFPAEAYVLFIRLKEIRGINLDFFHRVSPVCAYWSAIKYKFVNISLFGNGDLLKAVEELRVICYEECTDG